MINKKIYRLPIYQVKFSNWRIQKLNNFCSAFNLDFVETRWGEIIGLVEYKRKIEEMTNIELKYLPKIARALKVPYHIISCDIIEEENEFNIINKGIIETTLNNGNIIYKDNLEEKDFIKFFEQDIYRIYLENKKELENELKN